MADIAHHVIGCCTEIEGYARKAVRSQERVANEDHRLQEGNSAYDSVCSLLHLIPDSEPDSNGSPNFPVEGARLWRALLDESRQTNVEKSLLLSAREFTDWLLVHYQSLPDVWATDEWDYILFDDDMRQKLTADPQFALWLAKAYQVHATRVQGRCCIHPEFPWPNDMPRLGRHKTVVSWWFDAIVGIDPTPYQELLDATTDIVIFGDRTSDGIGRWQRAMHACYGVYGRAKALIDSGHLKVNRGAGVKAKKKPSATVNARMIDELARKPESIDWTTRQWASRLSCSESAVRKTNAWQKILEAREESRQSAKGKSIRPYGE